MTIIIISCDEYEDLWENHISLLKHFWPDCPYDIIFVNQEKKVSWPGIHVLNAGKGEEWSHRTLAALEHCKTPFVCLLVEDFFISAPIQTNLIEQTLELIQNYEIKYYKITNFSRAVKNHDPIFQKYPFLHVIFQDDDYGISVQPAIWEKNYLKKLLGTQNYNAWKFEFDRVKESFNKPHIPASGCIFDERNILHIKHGLIQGQYLPKTVKYFQKIGMPLIIKRPIMSWKNYYRTRLISKGKYFLPKSLRLPIKRLLEKCGMKFVSTIRDK